MILRDSTNPFDIPLDGLDAVAGYGDGPFAWSSAGWARFGAHIVPLSIVVSAAHAGDVLDVERFDATPAEAPGWADRFRRPGRRRPTIYCNRATIGAVRQAMAGRPFDWWAATLDGTLNGTDGAVAVQWKGQNLTGGHYDESLILDPSWIGRHVNTAASAAGGGEGSMLTITGVDGRSHRLVVRDGGQQDAEGNRGGPVHWICVAGGTGAFLGWPGGDGELPGGGGWVAAGTLAAELWTWPEKQRELLIVQGRGLDGQIWLMAAFTDDFSLESTWQRVQGPVVAIPGQAPLPGPPGPGADQLRADVAAALAATAAAIRHTSGT
ncbi:MAG: hypothetical protein AUG49_16005 [Catenulispora sp. 13_1_20CM_3_70_7]|nr:MAG: hypothetical protein AUG49_16005 [Catenulispora sp. 13_1_20CM_3_70_7]